MDLYGYSEIVIDMRSIVMSGSLKSGLVAVCSVRTAHGGTHQVPQNSRLGREK